MLSKTASNRKVIIMKAIIYCAIFVILVLVMYCVDFGSTADNNNYHNLTYSNNGQNQSMLWTYKCTNYNCVREKLGENEQRTTLETCSMLCTIPPLWPKPTDIQVTKKDSSMFSKNQVIITLNGSGELTKDLKEVSDLFINSLPKVNESLAEGVDITYFKVSIIIYSDENKLGISTNESYNLSVNKVDGGIMVNISVPTYLGTRHGLETLSQLIWLDSVIQKLKIIHDVQIYDGPKFPHRGLMVDTARNYFPVDHLLKVLDGMAATKLNVFHLHLTDSVSFPVILPNNKVFAEYGAYNSEMVYSPNDIKDLVEYARIRGIRVILEIDAPSHVNEGWNHKENLVVCGEDNVLNGHLHPTNEEALNVLESVYKDLLDLGSDSETFHIGGDEVNLTCWSETGIPKDFSTVHYFWANFTNKMFEKIKSANNNTLPRHIILWSSPLTNSYMSNLKHKAHVVVQYWYGSVWPILANGNKIIFSTVGRWYLDCGFGPWNPSMTHGVCDPYTPWQTFYKYRPWYDEFPAYVNQVLGGEACLWSEQVDVDSLETRIWPRAAALAERLWSDPGDFDEYDVYTRLDIHRNRLKSRGIKTAAMWPRWCSQNPKKC